MPDYLGSIWYSVGITLVLCLAMSIYIMVYFVPNALREGIGHIVRVRAGLRHAAFSSKLIVWLMIIASAGLVIAGIGALAVSFAGMCAAAVHAVLNFFARAAHADLTALIHEELSAGALPLRLASVSVFGTWAWMIRAHFKRAPKWN